MYKIKERIAVFGCSILYGIGKVKIWLCKGVYEMSDFMDERVDFGLHEECGVFGVYDFDGNDVASSIYYGLFSAIPQLSCPLCCKENRP